MLNTICNMLVKPSLYQETEIAFWDDPHISKQMLQAHLDPTCNGASRKLPFIEKSAAWIKAQLPPAKYPQLLDIGCGPGIYAERFTQAGYQVTGVDFSRRSIQYAQVSAQAKQLAIDYHCQNYLSLQLSQCFDCVTMIYCDYGALSNTNRQILLTKIYQLLKPGGKFLFDVFSTEIYQQFQEKQIWEVYPQGGFWREHAHIAFSGCYKYPDNITLEQIAILSHEESAVYYLWNTCYTVPALMKEVQSAGFQVCEVFGDIAGHPYDTDSPTIAILLEK